MTHTILLLGATGRSGAAVLDGALERGWRVRALVRRPEALAPREGLEVLAGTPLDPDAVAAALTGCDAVISTFNNNRETDGFFAKPVSPPGFMTDSIANTIQAMKAQARLFLARYAQPNSVAQLAFGRSCRARACPFQLATG